MSKATKIVVIALLSVAGLITSFGAGCGLGYATSPRPEPGFDIVIEAWNIIFQDYVDQDRLDASQLSQGAVQGMVEALDDPYTSYLDADTYQLALSSMEGKFEGIGAEISVKNGQLMIIAPIADSPAAEAGIRAGDKILEINGSPASEMSIAEVVFSIRGPKGTPVRLLIQHQDDTEPVEIEIIRAEIELPSIDFEMREDVAHISLTHFSQRTDGELSPVLQSITGEAPTGIILDLRSNPGGLLEAVVDTASYFLEDGVVVNVVDNQGESTSLTVRPNRAATDLPLVVLVDGYSASGSEVLAGALQDHGRAPVVGNTTYGKGSVNIMHQLDDGSALYITTARWLTPDGRPIEGMGIHPDYELEEEDDAVQWAIDYLTGNNQ